MKWPITLATLIFGLHQAFAAPALLVDATSGDVLFSRDATRSWHPASLTKLMTAHLALTAIEAGHLQMDTPVVISPLAAAAPPSKSGIPAGNALRLDEALRIMLVRSHNDIAIAIAETASGNVTDFVVAMNKEAAALGMSGTHFSNPNGLDSDKQVTTARDIAVLALAVSHRHKGYSDFFKMPFVTLDGKRLPNTNDLIGKYPGIDGMKTGYICSSGFNLVASASRHDKRLVSVVLGAPTKADRASMSQALLDLGFSGTAPKISHLRDMKSTEPSPVLAPPTCEKPRPQKASPPRTPVTTKAALAKPQVHGAGTRTKRF